MATNRSYNTEAPTDEVPVGGFFVAASTGIITGLTTNRYQSSRSANTVEGAYVTQVSITGRGVLNYASFTCNNSTKTGNLKIEIDGVDVWVKLGASGMAVATQGYSAIPEGSRVSFTKSFKMLTQSTNTANYIFYCNYDYWLTA